MAKVLWKPATLLNPVPAVMVSCMDNGGKSNIITIAWAGTVNSNPPMISISIRKERYSYTIINESMEFVVNLATKNLTEQMDYCGVKSGRDIDKFEILKLKKGKADLVKAPLIDESPVNLECKVKNKIDLGSHVMFIAKVVAVHVDDKYLDEKGKLCLDKANLICYSHGEYFELGKALGYFGFSVTKNKKKSRWQK